MATSLPSLLYKHDYSGEMKTMSKARVESELYLPAYARATARQDLSHICNLHHSSGQCWVLNHLSKDRDQTCNLIIPSWIH